MKHSEPIPRRKLYHEIVDRLTTRIMDGEFSPGDQLPSERQLMELYEVGRPAIREAMLSLERMGLITISHGERARVVAPSATSIIEQIAGSARHLITTSPQHFQHLKDARAFFEEGIVRQAAAKASDDDVAKLRALIEQQRGALKDTPAFLDLDMQFHRQIASTTDNPIYPALSQAVFEWLAAFHTGLVSAPGAEFITVDEHTRIVDEIANRDPQAAARAMSAHLRRANELYRQFER